MSSPSARLQDLRSDGAIGPARIVLYLAAYLGLVWISYIHPARGLNITPWNPQAALAVALLLWQPRAWWLVWVAVASGEALVGTLPVPWSGLVLASGASTAGYAAIAAALSRWLGRGRTVMGPRDVVRFLLVVAGGALLGAVLRAAALWATDTIAGWLVPTAIHRAGIGDGVGLLVTLPVLWVLAARERRAATRTMLRSGESWLIAAAAILGTVGVFAQPTEEQFKYFYVLFLPVVWAAARYGVVGAVWSAALVQMLLILAVQAAPYQPRTVFELQVLMAVLAGTAALLGAIVDEREEAQEALRASLRLAAAGDMAAALAHELNQPLTAVSNYARATQLLARSMADRSGGGSQDLVDVSDKLAGEATRAGEVVNRLRRFFRERATELQPTDLAMLIAEALASQQQRATSLGVRLSARCAPRLEPLLLDRVQIAVVLRNLLANAIDAADEDGHGERSVAIRAGGDARQVTVSVVDSGRGLAAPDLGRVFESRHSGKPGGMGIGLAISRSIVEAHGGRLWAEPGPGGKFHFTLPAGTGLPHD